MIDPIDRHEPIENREPADAIEPTDSTEPTEPIDRTEPLEAIDRTEFSDHSDHRLLSRSTDIERNAKAKAVICSKGDADGPPNARAADADARRRPRDLCRFREAGVAVPDERTPPERQPPGPADLREIAPTMGHRILAFVAGERAAMLHGAGHADARAVSYLAMTIWAYGEMAHGVNWFRHLLGLAYIVSTAVHLGTALGH